MFDQVPLGDEEIQFEVFPQSSDVSMPADLQAQIPQKDQEAARAEFSHFWQTYRPIILRPLSGSQRGSSILIVPNGKSRNIRSVFRKTPQGLPDEGYNEPSFDVFTFNERDQHLSLRHIDHLPIGQGKRGRDKAEREGIPNLKARLKLLARAATGQRWGEFLPADSAGKRNESDVSLLFEDSAVDHLIKRMTNSGLAFLAGNSFTMDFETGASAQSKSHDLSEVSKLYAERVRQAIDRWCGDVIPDHVRDTMKAVPGQQTTELFSYLNAKLTGKAKKAAAKGQISREVIQANRCDAIMRYPLLASDIGRFSGHSVSKDMDVGKYVDDPEAIIVDYWKSGGQRLSSEAVSFLAGLDERVIPASVAGRLYYLAPYLTYLEGPHQFPQTPKEWQSFANVVGVDKYFSDVYFRRKGQTVAEATGLFKDDETPWRDADMALNYQHSDLRWTVAETITRMASRVGLTRLAPILLNMWEEQHQELTPRLVKDADIKAYKSQLIAYCGATTSERVKDIGAHGTKLIELNGLGLSLMGHFYSKIPLSSLISMQAAFVTGEQRDWDKDIRRLAVSERFSSAAGNQKIAELPKLPDHIHQDDPGLQVVPVSSAGEAVSLLRDMKSRQAWDMLEDMVYEPVHFVFCVKAFNGKTEALCVLEEVSTSNGKLKLQLRGDRAIGRDDERGQLENRVIDKIQTYIEYVNAQELSAQEFREARERLRLNAEKLIGERATLGIRRDNIQEVVQAANKFNASCPEELRVSSFGGLRFGCPAVDNDFLYAFFARTIRELDPKSHPFQREKTASHLKRVV